MKKHSTAGRNLPWETSDLNQKCRQAAGRAAVVAALFVFMATYLYGISAFGIVAGIAFGWLPCGLAAWLTAIAVASAGTPLLRFIITTWRQLSLRALFDGSI